MYVRWFVLVGMTCEQQRHLLVLNNVRELSQSIKEWIESNLFLILNILTVENNKKLQFDEKFEERNQLVLKIV